MAWAKSRYIELIQSEATAVAGRNWSPTELAMKADMAFQHCWEAILGADPIFRWAKRTVTLDSNRRALVAVLDNPNPPSGTTQERWHRILDYRMVRDSGILLESERYYTVRRIGQYIQADDAPTSGTISVWVNHLPAPLSALADTADVTFPDGHEYVVVYHGAVLLLTQGGIEMGAAADLDKVAESLLASLLNKLKRATTAPAQLQPADNIDDWTPGGNY